MQVKIALGGEISRRVRRRVAPERVPTARDGGAPRAVACRRRTPSQTRARDVAAVAPKYRSNRVFFLQSLFRDPTVKQFLAAAKFFRRGSDAERSVEETCGR
jgi:hypothetical protein